MSAFFRIFNNSQLQLTIKKKEKNTISYSSIVAHSILAIIQASQ